MVSASDSHTGRGAQISTITTTTKRETLASSKIAYCPLKTKSREKEKEKEVEEGRSGTDNERQGRRWQKVKGRTVTEQMCSFDSS